MIVPRVTRPLLTAWKQNRLELDYRLDNCSLRRRMRLPRSLLPWVVWWGLCSVPTCSRLQIPSSGGSGCRTRLVDQCGHRSSIAAILDAWLVRVASWALCLRIFELRGAQANDADGALAPAPSPTPRFVVVHFLEARPLPTSSRRTSPPTPTDGALAPTPSPMRAFSSRRFASACGRLEPVLIASPRSAFPRARFIAVGFIA